MIRTIDRSIELNRSKSVKSLVNPKIDQDRLNKLKIKFKTSLDKLNNLDTKQVAFKELKEMISSNVSKEALRVFLELLLYFNSNASLPSKEIHCLLIGYLAVVFKEDLKDPLDKPVNIVKTVKKLSETLFLFLSDRHLVIHKSASHSLIELFSNSMPKEDTTAVSIVFLEPLISGLTNGANKNSQTGSAVCLAELIEYLIATKYENAVQLVFDKLVKAVIRSMNDSIHLYNLILSLVKSFEISKISDFVPDFYSKCIKAVGEAGREYKKKIVILSILKVLADKLAGKTEVMVGYYSPDIYDLVVDLTKDRVHRVQLVAQGALKSWKKLKEEHFEAEELKVMSSGDEKEQKSKKYSFLRSLTNTKSRFKGKKTKKIEVFEDGMTTVLRNSMRMSTKSDKSKQAQTVKNVRLPSIKTRNSFKGFEVEEMNADMMANTGGMELDNIREESEVSGRNEEQRREEQIQGLKEDFSLSLSKMCSRLVSKVESKMSKLEKRVNSVEAKIKDYKSKVPKPVEKPSSSLEQDSVMSKMWKEIIVLLENEQLNEAYTKILDSEDDIYLLRLVCLTQNKVDKLDFSVLSRATKRVCLVNRSNCVETLTVRMLEALEASNKIGEIAVPELNKILDELYSISMIDNEVGKDAAALYAKITREVV